MSNSGGWNGPAGSTASVGRTLAGLNVVPGAIVSRCAASAVVESFFGTLKKELIYRRSWPTRNGVAAAVHEYIEVFYNRRRRHTTNGGKAPAIFEALAQKQLTQAA